MILETLNKKVNPKKNISLSSWILEADKIAGQKLGAGELVWVGGNRRWGERREKGGLRRAWGNEIIEMEEGWIWEQGRYLN